MKKTLILCSILIAVFSLSASAQGCGGCKKTNCSKNSSSVSTTAESSTAAKTATDSLKVGGACGMCKTRIENAAKSVSGVSSATWNSATGMLIYTTESAVKREDVSKAITAVGHDTELGTAPDDVYKKLPGCCKYRD